MGETNTDNKVEIISRNFRTLSFQDRTNLFFLDKPNTNITWWISENHSRESFSNDGKPHSKSEYHRFGSRNKPYFRHRKSIFWFWVNFLTLDPIPARKKTCFLAAKSCWSYESKDSSHPGNLTSWTVPSGCL